MATILVAPQPILRTVCEAFDFANPQVPRPLELAQDMAAAMLQAKGLGLSAPQIGMPLRVFVIRANANQATSFFNPRIVERRGQDIGTEGCLSLPGVFLPITRSKFIGAVWQNHDGYEVGAELSGPMARCFQHELDHLDGKTIADKVSPMAMALARKNAHQRRKVAGWPR